MKRWMGLSLGLIWICGSAVAEKAPVQTLVAADEILPTRFVLCQREVGDVERDRKAKLRTCLARRLEGERIVQRNCQRQASSVSGVNPRAAAQRDCERAALGVPSTELPRRPPPPPRPKPVDAVAGAGPSATTAPAALRPAAGER